MHDDMLSPLYKVIPVMVALMLSLESTVFGLRYQPSLRHHPTAGNHPGR